MAASYKELTPEQAQSFIREKAPHLVDIRDVQSYENSHIDGAFNVPGQKLQDFLSSADRSRPVLCYCYKGISSKKAAQYFLSQGFKEVCHIIGGFDAWKEAYPE